MVVDFGGGTCIGCVDCAGIGGVAVCDEVPLWLLGAGAGAGVVAGDAATTWPQLLQKRVPGDS